VLTITTIDEWRTFCDATRTTGARIGLVPTMGALHDGHSALVAAARANGDVVVVTTFVNPLQFTSATDLATYPSTADADGERLRHDGAAARIHPSLAEMWPDYPAQTPTTISVRGFEGLEAVDRPGHFDGVATVVAKLFTITGPCRAYFGEKDYQQLAVVRQLVRDLRFDVEVIGVPTVRDEHGLALSSRNTRLSTDGLVRARGFRRALLLAQSSPATATALREMMRQELLAAGVAVAYAEIVEPHTLVPVADDYVGPARAMLAGVVDGVRLLDNDALMMGA